MAQTSRAPTIPCATFGAFSPTPMAPPQQPLKTPPQIHRPPTPPASRASRSTYSTHHADHELQQLRLFCPRQYFTGALNTWQSPELFEPLPHITAANIHDYLQATIPPTLRTRYKWGFRKTFTIPYGVVHLKEKKHWHKGRTIISYFQSLSGNLLRITSRALDIILQHLYPQHPGQLSIPQLWRHFHCYLTQTPSDISLHATNDDLVGFFNSVPQHRLIDAVHSMILHWQAQQTTHTPLRSTSRRPATPSTTPILVDTTKSIPPSAPYTLPTSPPLSGTHWTPAFSGHATTPTNKCEAPGLDPSCLQPFAMLPSHSSNTRGTRFTTTYYNTPICTLHTTDMSTTDSLFTTNTFYNIQPFKPSSTTTSLETQSNWNQLRTFISWAST